MGRGPEGVRHVRLGALFDKRLFEEVESAIGHPDSTLDEDALPTSVPRPPDLCGKCAEPGRPPISLEDAYRLEGEGLHDDGRDHNRPQDADIGPSRKPLNGMKGGK